MRHSRLQPFNRLVKSHVFRMKLAHLVPVSHSPVVVLLRCRCSVPWPSAAPEGRVQTEPGGLVLPESQGAHVAAGALLIPQSVHWLLQNDRWSPCPRHPCCLVTSPSACVSVGPPCAGSEQGWEGRPLSLGPCSALSSVREGPSLFPCPADGPTRSDCSHHLSFLTHDLPSTVQWGSPSFKIYNKHFEWGFTAHLLGWCGLAPTTKEGSMAASLWGLVNLETRI